MAVVEIVNLLRGSIVSRRYDVPAKLVITAEIVPSGFFSTEIDISLSLCLFSSRIKQRLAWPGRVTLITGDNLNLNNARVPSEFAYNAHKSCARALYRPEISERGKG